MRLVFASFRRFFDIVRAFAEHFPDPGVYS